MKRRPHSRSILSRHRNALTFQRKFILHATRNRLTDPSKILVRDFKQEFRRSAIGSVSATIGIDRSIF